MGVGAALGDDVVGMSGVPSVKHTPLEQKSSQMRDKFCACVSLRFTAVYLSDMIRQMGSWPGWRPRRARTAPAGTDRPAAPPPHRARTAPAGTDRPGRPRAMGAAPGQGSFAAYR